MAKNSFTLPAHSLVLTTDGFKPASSIHTGDFTIDSDGHAHPVVEVGNGGPLNCASILIGNDERHQLSGDEILASRFAKNDRGVMSLEPTAHRCPHDLTSPKAVKFDGIPTPPFHVADDNDDEPPSFDYVCSPNVDVDKLFDTPDFTDYELWLLGLYASNGTSSTYVIDDVRSTDIDFDADGRVSNDLLLLRHIESMASEAEQVGIRTVTTPDMEHARFSGTAHDDGTFAYKVAQMYGPLAGSRQIGGIVPDEYCVDWTSDAIGIPVGALLLDDDKLDKFLEGYSQDFAPLGGVPRSSGVPCRSLPDALMLRLLIHKRYGCRAFLRHGGSVTVSDNEMYSDVMPVPTHTYDMWFVSFDSTDADGSDYANAFDDNGNSYMSYCVSRAGTERQPDDCVEVVVENGDTVVQDSLIVFGTVCDEDNHDDEVIEIEDIVETNDNDNTEIDEVIEVIDNIDIDDDDDDVVFTVNDDEIDDDDELGNDSVQTDENVDIPAAIRRGDDDTEA